MTEDDTFTRLKRLPFDIMISRAIDYVYTNVVSSDSTEVQRFLKDNGWTKEELNAEWSRRYPRGPHSI